MLGNKRRREAEFLKLQDAQCISELLNVECVAELRALGIRQLVVLQTEELCDLDMYFLQAFNEFGFSLFYDKPLDTVMEKEYNAEDIRIAKTNLPQILIFHILPPLLFVEREFQAELAQKQIVQLFLSGLLLPDIVSLVLQFLQNHQLGNSWFLNHMASRIAENVSPEERFQTFWQTHCHACAHEHAEDDDENLCDNCQSRQTTV